jgi:hypothetical protein
MWAEAMTGTGSPISAPSTRWKQHWTNAETAKKRINELLDRETTLQNGDKIKFGAAIEQALKLLRANDGFLLQWVPKPEAEALVNRHFNRIAQIKEQILPTLDTWYIRKQIARKNRLLAATRLRNPEQLDREMIRKDIEKLKKQQRELDGQRRDVMDELATLSAAIATRKDPSNLNYFDLEAVYIMPIVMQTDTKTVLNLAGLLNVSHVGTRMHDTIVACIPAPKPDFGRAVAEKALDHDNDLHEKVAPSDRNAAERGLLARSPNEETTSEKGLEEVVYIRRALWRSPISDDDSDRVDSDGSDIGSSTEQVSETPPRRRLGPFRSTGEELVALDESPSIKRTPFKELGEARIERLARIRASSGQGDTSE